MSLMCLLMYRVLCADMLRVCVRVSGRGDEMV